MFPQLLARLRGRKAPTELPLALEPLTSDVQPDAVVIDDSKVAFTALHGSVPVQVLFPTITRQHRIEPDVVVFSLIYRDFQKAMQYLVFHGKVRKELGCSRINLMTAETDGLRDDEVLANAIEHGKDVLWAMRHPVTCPEVVEPLASSSTDASAVAPPAKAVLGDHQANPAVAGSPMEALQQCAGAEPVLTLEGEFLSSGMLPYKHPVSKQVGKPSFAVVLNIGGVQTNYHGSDLQRALRQAGVLPGDRVQLHKYPKQKVRLGDRTVEMNLWDCTVVDRA